MTAEPLKPEQVREALDVALLGHYALNDTRNAAKAILRRLLESRFVEAAMEYNRAMLRDARNDVNRGIEIDRARGAMYDAYRRLMGGSRGAKGQVVSELKPCPFCGGEAERIRSGAIMCKCASMMTHDGTFPCPGHTAGPKFAWVWNRRAADPSVLKRLEEIEGEIRRGEWSVERGRDDRTPKVVRDSWADAIAALRKEMAGE